MFINKTT